MTTWCLSLPGDVAWWQAFAGMAQAVFAAAIVWVTWKYVGLTKDLRNLQADIVNLQKQGERRELYDRRVKVYDALMSFGSDFVRDMRVDVPAIVALLRNTREAEFLFGPEIPELIRQVAGKAHEHRVLSEALGVAPNDVEHSKRLEAVEIWLMDTASDEAKERFGRYLKLFEPTDLEPSSN